MPGAVRSIVLSVCVLLASLGAASGQGAQPEAAQAIEPALQADILRLIEVTGSAKMGEQMGLMIVRQMTDQMRQLRPDVPQRAVEIVTDVVREKLINRFAAPDGLLPRMVPLYAKHFTRDEIRGLIAFYESDLGRKAVTEMPALFEQGARIGQDWAKGIMPSVQAEIEKRFKAEGIVK